MWHVFGVTHYPRPEDWLIYNYNYSINILLDNNNSNKDN